MYVRAALIGMQVCFRRHTFLDPSARVTLQAAANHFSCNLLFCPSFSKKLIAALMYSTLVGPLPLFNVAFVCLRRSRRLRPNQLTALLLRCLRCHWWLRSLRRRLGHIRRFSHPRNDPDFTTDKALLFSGGCRAQWHSWADANPCVPCRHYNTLINSLRCSFLRFSFSGAVASCKKLQPRVAISGLDWPPVANFEIHPFSNHAQTGWEIRVPH